jgi:hypothetical protein
MVKHIVLSGGAFDFLKFASKLKSKIEPKIKKGLKIGKKVAEIYASPTFKKLLDLIPSSDEKARSGFPGEQHSIIKVSKSKFGIANYMGPGTHVVERVRRGDVGRTPADVVAELHDCMYYLAQLAKNKEEQIKLVREADERMVESLKLIKKDKLDFPINITIGMRIIQAKMLAEDAGLFDKGSFGGELKKHPSADVALIKKHVKKLMSYGY